VAKQHATELQEQFGSVETAFIAQDRKREAGEKQLIGLQGKLSSLAAKRAGLAKEFEKLDRSGTICPVCGGTLSDKALAKEMKRIEQALEELDVEEAGLSKSVRQTEDEVAGARVAVQKLSDTYTRQRAEIKEAFDISSKRARDCAQNAAELKATRSELAAEEAAKNNFDDMLEAASQRLDVSIKEQEEHKRVIGELQKRLGALEYWAKGFKQVKLWLVEQALTELEIEVNSSLVLLGLQDWRIRFDVERETTSGTTSKGFTIFIESPLSGEQSVPWEAWSGGETQRLRIAGAIGLASLIRSRQGCECNLEIWDEPTAHLSEEGITDLLTFFETRARSLQRQIWLVDHRSLNAGNFDHEVTVVKTVQGSQIKQA
jgi:DNA repair exonuclease SbcCD ATPase subunit